MDMLFAGMGTALVFFIYKTITLQQKLNAAKGLIIGIATGEVNVRVNHETHEIALKWKEEK